MQLDIDTHEHLTLFDINDCEQQYAVEIESAATTILTLGKLAMEFARVERVPRYDPESRENDAEHSFMLALVATEIARQYFPELDAGLVTQFSIVHDLVELETNDVATFILDDASLAVKEAAEMAALDRLAAKLPPHTRELLLRYEEQIEIEARLVRLLDKKLPLVSNIYGPGRKVMIEDYGIETPEALAANEQRFSERLKTRFPESRLALLHHVRAVLAAEFSAMFNA